MTRREIGGVLLVVGAAMTALGLYDLGYDFWPDGELTTGRLLLDMGLLILPGLFAMGIGAGLGRRAGRRDLN